MSIPANTAGGRAHLLARDPRCDTFAVLNMAARRVVRRRFADMNACAGADDDWNLHYADGMAANHYTHIVDAKTGRIRPCTHAEAHTPVDQIHKAQMLRYRKDVARGRAKRKGRHKWVRPRTVYEVQRRARLLLVKVCWEIKSRVYATNPALARRFVASVRRAGGTAYFMTLVNMWGFGGKLKNFKLAGAETALMGHGVRLTPAMATELAQHRNYIDVQWGAFAGGRRMGPRNS
jgi:hypothetical protein